MRTPEQTADHIMLLLRPDGCLNGEYQQVLEALRQDREDLIATIEQRPRHSRGCLCGNC